MKRPVRILLPLLALLAIFLAFALVWEHPFYRRYGAAYAGGFQLNGYGNGYFRATYWDINFFFKAPHQLANHPLVVHVDGQAIPVSQLTPQRLVSLGAIQSPNRISGMTEWCVVDGAGCVICCYFKGSDLVQLSSTGHGKPSSRLKISWKGQQPIAMPISDSEMKTYFGKSPHIRKWHDWDINM